MNKCLGLLAALVASAMSFSGCSSETNVSHSPAAASPSEAAVPAVSARELEALVQQSEQPILVEFGVDVACFRCEEMRPHVGRLAREFAGRARVVRVDFNANRQLAARFGANICPSYALINQGQVVATRCFPTSGDLIAAELDALLPATAGL